MAWLAWRKGLQNVTSCSESGDYIKKTCEETKARIKFLEGLPGITERATSLEDIVKDLVSQTSGYMPRDLQALIADTGSTLVHSHDTQDAKVELRNLRKDSLETKLAERNDSHDSAKFLWKEDIMKSPDRSKKRNASALDTPKVPNVKWEDVAGLEDMKKSILDTVQVHEHAILLNPGSLWAVAMQEQVLIFNYNCKGGKAFIDALLPC